MSMYLAGQLKIPDQSVDSSSKSWRTYGFNPAQDSVIPPASWYPNRSMQKEKKCPRADESLFTLLPLFPVILTLLVDALPLI